MNNTFAPTPYEEPHVLQELKCLQRGWNTCRSQPPDLPKKIEGGDPFKDVVLELVGNLYGRRPAGSNYRKEFEQLVTEKMDTKGYSFQRGKRDPTV